MEFKPCGVRTMLYQLSCRANWELVILWVDYRPTDDGYRCLYEMLIHESHVFELRSETKYKVCDPRGCLTLIMQLQRRPQKASVWSGSSNGGALNWHQRGQGSFRPSMQQHK